ncbi:MAG: GWxTD domain-containing protein [Ignavibacteriales bacterium]
MKKIILSAILIFTGISTPQSDDYSETPVNRVKYYQDFIGFKGAKGKTRLDVYLQVPYDAVQFIKTGQGFEASYSLTVSIFDESKENLITEKIWNEKIIAISYEQTTSPDNFNLSHRSFEISPGVYSFKTSLLDKDSKNEYSSENTFLVKDFNSSPSMSDVMLISKKTIVEGNTKIIPNVSRNIVSDRDELSAFFEIYSDTSTSFTVNYEIIDEKDNVVYDSAQKVEVKSGNNQVFNAIDSLTLNLGNYLLRVSLISSDGKLSGLSKKSFVSRWFGVPNSITDLDKSVDQLIYIANPEDLDYINASDGRLEKAKRFVAFWKKYDSNPADEYNPVFNEYFNRIAYANENFTTYSLEGWRSDRGMVLVILGVPDNIDRHPFEYYAKPYEVWQYYSLNRSFLFVDNSGFGDYRLSPDTPLYGDLYRFRY